MKHVTYQLETLTCPSCMAKIEGMLKKTDGVSESQVLFNASKVKVQVDESVVSPAQVRQRIEDLGYKVLGER